MSGAQAAPARAPPASAGSAPADTPPAAASRSVSGMHALSLNDTRESGASASASAGGRDSASGGASPVQPTSTAAAVNTVVDHHPPSPAQGGVLSRLTALFHHDPARDPGPSSAFSANTFASNAATAGADSAGASPVNRPVAFPGADDDDALFDDADAPPTPPPKDRDKPKRLERNAIKVLVVTWNMGDALPKGDLSVLLGDVPAYEPTVARDAVEGLPLLPIENVHPYHIVVFAAQECPTPSGVPRGLGGGLMKGVGLQNPQALFRSTKEKEKDGAAKDKDATTKEGKDKERDDRDKWDKKGWSGDDEKPASKEKPAKDVPSPTEGGTSTPRKPGLALDRLGLEGLGLGLGTPTRGPMSPTEEKPSPFAFDDDRHHGGPVLRPPAGMAPGPKGWSAMLEEWLCAGPLTGPRAPTTLPPQTPQSTAPYPTTNSTPGSTLPLTVLTSPSISANSTPIDGQHDGPSIITASPIDMDTDSPWSPNSPPRTPAKLAPPTPAKESPPQIPAKPTTPIPKSSSPAPTKPIGIPGSLTPSLSTPIPNHAHHPPGQGLGVGPLAAPSAVHHRSPLSMSFEPGSAATTSFGTSYGTTTSTAGSGAQGSFHIGAHGSLLVPPPDRPERELNRSPSQRSDRSERLDSGYDKPRREPGTGPYVNVAKERLLGLYLSVFVYRGCEHLVRGVDKDYVTAGLAGGRFGNKGGIGISLNLNGHRLLFVNAHLAAHTERNDARLANIAKIKSELSLNCFLPPDDPRAMCEDITDRFDTTFWCGDLNFRVDISLLHARWLLEQKKYHEALMFDQLKKAMEDPRTNPFPGFEEAPITFMPTFKYDVWKSVRATNREIRRSLRKRRNTLEKHERPASMDTPHSHATLEFVPEGDGPEESGSDRERGKSSGCSGGEDEKEKRKSLGGCTDVTATTDRAISDRAISDRAISEKAISDSEPGHHARDEPPSTPVIHVPDCTLDGVPIPDGASTRSSVYAGDMSQSFAHSFTTDTDREPRLSGDFSFARSSFSRSPRPTSSIAGGSFMGGITGTSPLPKRGIKEKTKKLFGMLNLGRRVSATRTATPKDEPSRRLSVSSYHSVVMSEGGRSHVSNFSSEGPASPTTDEIGKGVEDKERSHSAGASDRHGAENGPVNGILHGSVNGNGHAHQGTPNGLGLEHKHPRRSSNASQKLLSSPPRRHLGLLRRTASGRSALPGEDEYTFDLDGFDDTKDHRVGRYDTSKKQRVPSWCDRVLYKTHIIPDEEVIDDDESSRLEFPTRFGRLSHALSNLGDHFRRRSTIFEPASADRDRELSVPSTPPGRLEATVAPSSGLLMTPRRDQFAEQLRDSPESAMRDLDPSADDALPRSLGNRSITFDDRDRDRDRESTPEESLPPPLVNRSITFDGPPMTPRTPRDSPERQMENRSSPRKRRMSSADSTPSRRASQSRRGSVSSRRGSVSASNAGSTVRRRLTDSGGNQLAQLTHVKSTGHSVDLGRPRRRSGDFNDTTRARRLSDAAPPQLNVIARFLRDLPGRFHSRVSLFHGSDTEVEEKRGRLAGEVEVLHYGTIDDAGMRQLEGRSDHRPAIFAAAIYV